MAQSFVNETISAKTPSIGVFTFGALLNIGMLLTNSERDREVRAAILTIVIDVLNKKMGGSTKYINQREEEFLPSAIREFNYRQAFTNSLEAYIEIMYSERNYLCDEGYIADDLLAGYPELELRCQAVAKAAAEGYFLLSEALAVNEVAEPQYIACRLLQIPIASGDKESQLLKPLQILFVMYAPDASKEWVHYPYRSLV